MAHTQTPTNDIYRTMDLSLRVGELLRSPDVDGIVWVQGTNTIEETAYFLHLTGRIPSNRTHPKSAPRPAWEAEMMKDCALRLGLLQG